MIHHDFELAEHPDTHFHHLYRNLPKWVLESSAETRVALKNASLEVPPWHGTATRLRHQALKASSQTHWTLRNHLGAKLAKLQNARDFAESILAPALKTRFDLEVDVNTTFLRLYIPQTIPLFPVVSGAARTWTVSLLDAALHNFQHSETEANAYEPASTFITRPTPTGQFDTLPQVSRKLTIQAFTRLCRELDIGRQYNAYLKDNLGLTNRVAAAVLKPQVIRVHQAAFRSALHLGLACQDIESDAYNALECLLEGRAPRPLDGHYLHCHDLTMMSSSLTGIIIFGAKSGRASRPTSIIAYIPDDPEHPLKQYPDTVAFMTELTRKLRSPAYQAFFSRFVDHQERGHFFADLNRRLQSVTWHQHAPGDPLPSWRETPIDKPNLKFSMTPFRAGLWNHLYQRQLNKIINDASTLAVSTARADQIARWALWDAFSKVASIVLEVATFVAMPFVSLLGELMLAYMAYQVLDETFDGIVDWAQGLKKEAFGHLMGIVETVIEAGTFAVGGAIAAGTFGRLLTRETAALIAPLKAVPAPEGKTRYWKPDLVSYEQAIMLSDQGKPDHLGLLHHEGKTLLPLEGKLYAVQPTEEHGQFQIEHPRQVDTYKPLLRHNGHGAWQTELEQPLSWDRETVMRRLGSSVEGFSNSEREQILLISGFNDNVVREIHVENHRPPSLLTDTIKRFRIDRDIQTFIEQIGSDQPEHYRKANPVIQHQLLTRYDSWPAETPLPELHVQTPALRKQTADIACNHRKALFEHRYREQEKTNDLPTQRLLAEVPGLPTDIAQELVSNASGNELRQLHNGHVPRRLKDVAVKAMEAVRATRAFEGLYSDSLATADTDQLVLHSLDLLPGWPTHVRIEVRDFSRDGQVHDSVGPNDASVRKTLVRNEDGQYQSEDGGLPGDFYQAVLQVLPDTERNALGFATEDGQRLKQRIAEHALARPQLRTLFAKNPHRKPFYDPTTMRLPGGAEGYPRTGPATPTLNERVREVYPSLPEDEIQSMVLLLQRHPSGARVELSRLTNELACLHQDLGRWINDAPTVHPQTRLALSDLDREVARRNRTQLAQEIQRSWRRQSERDFAAPDGIEQYVLRFAEPIPGDLPTLTADFSHISVLSLEGDHGVQGIPEFLQRFNGLRRLELRRFNLTTLPDAITRMPNLDSLVLGNCGIRFDAATWSKLSASKKLVMLDLYRNPFEQVPNLESMSDLNHLDLSHTGLTEFPASVLQHTKLDTLMLLNNKITELPPGLFDSPVCNKQGVSLTHNPLSNEARQRIKQHHVETAYDLGVFAPQADIERVTALYPGMDVEQASDFLYELPGTLADGRVELTRLETELTQLRNDLSARAADLPARHPLTGEPFDAQQQLFEHASRDEFKQLLERCWRHDIELDDFDEALEPSYELVIRSPINGDLPTLSADFSHVSMLEMKNTGGVTGMGRFLEPFANLKSLRLRECNLGNIPDAVFKMGKLRSLSLPDCRIRLAVESVKALAGMDQLDYLDLGYNPLGHTPDLSQMKELTTVLLNDTGITEIPAGLLQINDVDWVDLSSNAITEVPSDIMELPLEIAENMSLRGNRFSEESLLRLIRYYERTGADFGVEEVINRGEMEVTSSDTSEFDE